MFLASLSRMGLSVLIGTLFHVPAHANPLAQELVAQASNKMYWKNRRRFWTQFEQYHYRSHHFDDHVLTYLQAQFSDPNHIETLNHMISTRQTHRFYTETVTYEYQAQYYDFILKSLPSSQLSSYQGRYLKNAHWDQLQIGDLFAEEGFLHTSAHLPLSYKHLHENFIADFSLTPVLIKVESDQGRLVNALYSRNRADLLFPQDAVFQVADKFYDAQSGAFLLHLKDISQEEALLVELGQGKINRWGQRELIDYSCSSSDVIL